jgi:hypothetical protein
MSVCKLSVVGCRHVVRYWINHQSLRHVRVVGRAACSYRIGRMINAKTPLGSVLFDTRSRWIISTIGITNAKVLPDPVHALSIARNVCVCVWCVGQYVLCPQRTCCGFKDDQHTTCGVILTSTATSLCVRSSGIAAACTGVIEVNPRVSWMTSSVDCCRAGSMRSQEPAVAMLCTCVCARELLLQVRRG